MGNPAVFDPAVFQNDVFQVGTLSAEAWDPLMTLTLFSVPPVNAALDDLLFMGVDPGGVPPAPGVALYIPMYRPRRRR